MLSKFVAAKSLPDPAAFCFGGTCDACDSDTADRPGDGCISKSFPVLKKK